MNTSDEESPLSQYVHEPLDPEVVHLIAMENPFDPSTRHHDYTDWYEGMTLADALGPSIHTDHWFVTLNGGVYQDMDQWEKILINKGDCILGAPIPRGGGSTPEQNRKMAIRMVAMIAIVALTVWWNPALTAALGSAMSAATAGAVAAGINAAVIAGGSMLINALLPMPAADINDEPGDQTYGIDGPKPTSLGNIPIPVCYGPHTMAGNVIAMHTERHGNKQHLNILMNAGEGPIAGISDIYVNDQTIGNFPSVSYWVRTGEADQAVIPNFDQIIIPVNVGYTLVGIDDYYHTTSVCDRLRVDVSWPAGVNRSSKSKGIKSNNVMFYLNIAPADDPNNWEYFIETPHAYHPQGPSALFGLDMTTRTPQRRSYWSKPLPRGAWRVWLRRLKPGHIENADTIVITDINEVHNGSVQYNNTALIGMNIKLDDVLSTIPRITYTNQGKIIRTYNGSTWSTSASDNPAWIAWDILTNDRYGGGLEDSRLDLPTFYEWAQFCDTKGLTFHGVFGTNGQPLWDSLAPVFRSGHAIPIRIGSRYAVTIETTKPSTMLFSSGNIKKGTLKLAWLPMEDRANEIEVSFYDKEERHKQRTVSVYDTLAHASNFPMRKGRIALQGIDSEEQAIKEGIFTINMNRLSATASWESHIDAIAVMIGDVVDVQHDMPQWGYGGRLEDGNTLATLKLDIDVPFTTGVSYAARVLLSDDSLEERDIVNPGTGDFNTVTLTSDLSSIPPKGAIWSIGEINKVVKPFTVKSISGTGDHYRQISAIEYVPEVYDDDIAGFTPSHSALEGTIGPAINVTIVEEIDQFEFDDGSGVQLVIEWEHDDPEYQRADVYVSIERSEWVLLGSGYNNYTINDVKIDHNYYIVIVPIRTDGVRGHFEVQPEYTYFVTGVPLGVPETPVSFAATPYSRYVDLSWFTPSNPGPGRLPSIGYFLIYWAPHYNPGVDPIPTFADAIVVGNTVDNFYTHAERVPDTDNFYWIVNANRANTAIRSPEVACLTNPVHTLEETFQSVFGRGVEDYDLSSTLGSRIDLIDTPVTGLQDRMTDTEADADQALIDAAAALSAAQAAESSAGQAQTDATQALADAAQNASDIIANDGDISTIQGDVLDHTTDINNLETTVNDPSTGVNANASAISLLDTRVIAAEGTIIGHTTDITGLQTTVNDGTKGVIANYNNYVTLDGRIDTNDGILSGHGGRLDTLELTVNHGTQGVTANYNSYVALDGRMDTAEGTLSSHVTKITNLESTVNNGTQGVIANYNAVVTLDTRVDGHDGTLTSHLNKISNLETTVNDGVSGVVANYNNYVTLDGRVDGHDGDISGHGGRLDSLEVTVNHGTSGVTANYNNYVALDGRMDTAEGTLSSHVTKISNLESTVNNGTSGVTANYNAVTTLDTRVDGHDGTLSGHGTRLDNLETTVNDPVSGVQVIYDWAVIADGRINTNEGDISGQGTRITNLETTVNHGTQGVVANYNSIVTVDGRVDTTNGVVSGHTGRLDTLETTVNNPTSGGTALASAINAVDTTATAADGRSTANATSIGTLNTTVGNHSNTISTQGTSIDGLHGQWSVKIDNSSGHVAGFGLSNTAPEYSSGAGHSEFMVLVDRFAVASPTATDLSFEIESGEVRMNGAKIKDASIDNVKIGNTIQSNAFNMNTGTGWRLTKSGRIEAGEITIYDNSGDVIIQSGNTTPVFNAQIDNDNVPKGQMLADPNFEYYSINGTFSGDPNWTSYEGTFKTLNDPPRGYIPYMTTGGYSVGLSDQRLPVQEGTPLYATITYYEESGYTGGETVLRVFWYDKDRSAQSPQWVDYQYAQANQPKNQWTTQSVVIFPPPYAGFCRVLLEGDSLTGTGKHYLEGITLSTSPTFIDIDSTPTFIKDLAVDTLQIANNAVTIPFFETGRVDDIGLWHEMMNIQTTPSKVGAAIRIDWHLNLKGGGGNSEYCRIKVYREDSRGKVQIIPFIGGFSSQSMGQLIREYSGGSNQYTPDTHNAIRDDDTLNELTTYTMNMEDTAAGNVDVEFYFAITEVKR